MLRRLWWRAVARHRAHKGMNEYVMLLRLFAVAVAILAPATVLTGQAVWDIVAPCQPGYVCPR